MKKIFFFLLACMPLFAQAQLSLVVNQIMQPGRAPGASVQIFDTEKSIRTLHTIANSDTNALLSSDVVSLELKQETVSDGTDIKVAIVKNGNKMDDLILHAIHAPSKNLWRIASYAIETGPTVGSCHGTTLHSLATTQNANDILLYGLSLESFVTPYWTDCPDANKLVISINWVNTDPLGIENTGSKNTVSVFPNPASNMLTVSDFSGKVIITDMIGHIVLAENVEAKKVLNVSQLPRGIYSARLIDKQNVVTTTKVVLQ